MAGFVGTGEKQTWDGSIKVTGISENIPDSFTLLNKVNFPNLIFTHENEMIDFNESTGEITFKIGGCFELSGILNLKASQASAQIEMVPEYDFGSGWVYGSPRHEILTAIKPRHVTFFGSREIPQNTKARFYFRANSGNIIFETETIDPGGEHECILPAIIFYANMHRACTSLIGS